MASWRVALVNARSLVRLLDIATDVASETVFTGCLAAAALNSATLPAFLTGYCF